MHFPEGTGISITQRSSREVSTAPKVAGISRKILGVHLNAFIFHMTYLQTGPRRRAFLVLISQMKNAQTRVNEAWIELLNESDEERLIWAMQY